MEVFKNIIQKITGHEEVFSLEHRIFNISSFFIVTFNVLGAIANYLIGLDTFTVWLCVIGAGISAILFYKARILHHFSVGIVIVFVFAAIGVLGTMHFYNGGIDGTIIYVFIILQGIFLLIIPVRFEYWIYAIMYTNILVLILLEFFYPQMVLHYDSRDEKMVDHAVTLLYALFYSTIVLVTFRRSYHKERQKVVEQNNQLVALNEQNTWQRKRLEEKTVELEKSVEVANERHEYINTLLRELNHRVKNNLQVISSLLNLQAHAIQDENARKAILEGKNRLVSMILVHQRLYQNENSTTVYIVDYLKELAETIMYSYSGAFDEEVLEYDIEPLWLDVESAIPLGLICNELISNAFKHAFHNTAEPLLSIKLVHRENQYLLEIADNGSGMNKSAGGKTFGLDLVRSMVKQLQGTLSIEEGGGTRFSIQFSKSRNVGIPVPDSLAG